MALQWSWVDGRYRWEKTCTSKCVTVMPPEKVLKRVISYTPGCNKLLEILRRWNMWAFSFGKKRFRGSHRYENETNRKLCSLPSMSNDELKSPNAFPTDIKQPLGPHRKVVRFQRSIKTPPNNKTNLQLSARSTQKVWLPLRKDVPLLALVNWFRKLAPNMRCLTDWLVERRLTWACGI